MRSWTGSSSCVAPHRRALLTLLQMKAALDKDEAVVDEGVAAAYVDNFATKIFDQADAEDRAGKATRYGSIATAA